MKKIIAIFAIIAVVAASGCLGRGGDQIILTKGYGLEITNFTSNIYSLYSGQTTHITLIVENQGDSKVTKDNGLALLIIPGDWEVTQAKNQPLKKDLYFEDLDRGAVAGSDQFTWTIKAPVLVQGQTRTDSVTGRIYYDYKTTATGTLWLYPEAEATSERGKGVALNQLTYQGSRGPVEITISVVPDPVTVYSSGEMFTMNLEFRNIGGGTVYKNDVVTSAAYDISDANRNVISVTATIQGLTVVPGCLDHIEFFGDTATAICDVTVPSVPYTKQSYPITVTTDYGYYTDQTVYVDVTGR